MFRRERLVPPRSGRRPAATSAAAPAKAAPAPARGACACGGGCPRCGGRALDGALRRGLESQLGAGLASVRVHTDAEAARLTAAHGARALTLGEHVFFAPGRFAPHGGEGTARLAHELVHVVQQRAGRAGAAASTPRAAEAEARSLGAAVAAGARVHVRSASAPRPQADGPETASPDADSEHSALRHYLRWWLGGVLLRGAPSLPAADD